MLSPEKNPGSSWDFLYKKSRVGNACDLSICIVSISVFGPWHKKSYCKNDYPFMFLFLLVYSLSCKNIAMLHKCSSSFIYYSSVDASSLAWNWIEVKCCHWVCIEKEDLLRPVTRELLWGKLFRIIPFIPYALYFMFQQSCW